MMTRIILFIGLVFFPGISCVKEPDKGPNIIFILTDDQRWDALGYAGNDIILTPEMDRLAKEGVYFKNAFVTTPICAASRASILTGLYERTHGYTFNTGNIKNPYIKNSYPALMKGSEYFTGFFGKFGVQYEYIDSLFNVSDNYDRGRHKDSRGYFYKTLDGDTVHLTRYTGQQALDFINNAPENQPFCLSLSFSAPHAHDPAPGQYFWQDEVDHLYRDQEMPPPLLGDDKYFEGLPDDVKKGYNRARWYWRYDTYEKYQHSRKGYYRMISGIDIEIGRIRKLLLEKEIADNTIIILMGDNGYFEGERQLAGKWLMYDNSLRVPLIIYDPRSDNSMDIDQMSLNIDIAPTIMDYAGLPIPAHWQGKSLAGYTRGNNPLTGRKEFLCEHLWEVDIIPPSEGLRTQKWKYFRYRNDLHHEELYDLESDPLETINLADEDAYSDILIQLRSSFEQLAQKLTSQRLVE